MNEKKRAHTHKGEKNLHSNTLHIWFMWRATNQNNVIDGIVVLIMKLDAPIRERKENIYGKRVGAFEYKSTANLHPTCVIIDDGTGIANTIFHDHLFIYIFY